MAAKIAFTASGDALIMEKFPYDYHGYHEISRFIRKGDIRLTNLEVVLTDFNCFASSYCGGTWLGARPVVLEELLSYGFNMISCANNHTMDYSYNGLISTIKHLDDAKIAYAGAGMDLHGASRPVYIDTSSGRAALVSICSTFDDAARAGEGYGPLPGRPGLNPLRFKIEYVILQEQMEVVKQIAKETKMNGRINNSMKQGYTPKNPEGTQRLGQLIFRTGNDPGKVTKVDPVDMARTEKTIKEALTDAEHVIVAAHSHECRGESDIEPDGFFVDFCHRCIDAGASGVVGSGTHQLRPIEIYKDRPIFYSLGNFIFQSDSPEILPADFYERYGYSKELTAKEAIDMRNQDGKRGLHNMELNFRSVIPYWEIEYGRLIKLELMPIELGFGKSISGWPGKAENANEILQYLQQICKPYGTKMTFENGLIVVQI